MAEAMTFTSLKADMRRYLERGAGSDAEVIAQIPRLIGLAERQIATDLKIQGFITVVTSTMAAGTSVYAKPDRWRRTISINFGVGTSPNQQRAPLYPRSYEYLRTYWPNSESQATPEFYADYGYTHWLIAPTPNAAYPFEVNYFGLPPLLDATNETNWLTDYAPNALLYRALVEAEPFMKNDERLGVWKSLYAESLASLNSQDLQKIVDRGAVRQEA